ncbi:MAG: CoA-binding protein, partial [Thermoplasmatota archaeon]
MDTFFNPQGVAVVGASSSPGKIGYEILSNILASGVAAYPVNPRAERILGLTCYPSVSAIPEPVDLAVVAVPAPALLEVVEDCGRAGVRAMV